MKMKVIGAGLPRTGTLTQKIALEMLGLGPCYHMVNVLGNLDLVPQWRAALDGKADWERIFDGHQSEVDWPGSFYYRELIEAYPEAKVVLSVRDPAGWERSMRNTIVDVLVGDSESVQGNLSRATAAVDPKWRAYVEMMIDMWVRQGVFEPGGTPREDLGQALTDHTEKVKRAVPADKLLVWDVSEGWGPLCEFLEVGVPEAPLPHVNDSTTFVARIVDRSLGTLNAWWELERPPDPPGAPGGR